MAANPNKRVRAVLQSYHLAWLSAHPSRTKDWLKRMLKDGFHVHHVDGDHSNDAPENLALMDGVDHMRLHSVDMRTGISRWRKSSHVNGLKAMQAANEQRRALAQPPIDEESALACMSRLNGSSRF